MHVVSGKCVQEYCGAKVGAAQGGWLEGSPASRAAAESRRLAQLARRPSSGTPSFHAVKVLLATFIAALVLLVAAQYSPASAAAPTSPAAPSATRLGTYLLWVYTNPVPGATGYRLFQNGVQVQQRTQPSFPVTLNLNTLPTLSFQVAAYNTQQSPLSVATTYVTTPGPIGVPPAPSVVQTSDTSVSVSWPVLPGATGYRLTYGTVSVQQTSPVFTVTGLSLRSTYTFRVAPYNNSNLIYQGNDQTSDYTMLKMIGVPVSAPTFKVYQYDPSRPDCIAFEAISIPEFMEGVQVYMDGSILGVGGYGWSGRLSLCNVSPGQHAYQAVATNRRGAGPVSVALMFRSSAALPAQMSKPSVSWQLSQLSAGSVILSFSSLEGDVNGYIAYVDGVEASRVDSSSNYGNTMLITASISKTQIFTIAAFNNLGVGPQSPGVAAPNPYQVPVSQDSYEQAGNHFEIWTQRPPAEAADHYLLYVDGLYSQVMYPASWSGSGAWFQYDANPGELPAFQVVPVTEAGAGPASEVFGPAVATWCPLNRTEPAYDVISWAPHDIRVRVSPIADVVSGGSPCPDNTHNITDYNVWVNSGTGWQRWSDTTIELCQMCQYRSDFELHLLHVPDGRYEIAVQARNPFYVAPLSVLHRVADAVSDVPSAQPLDDIRVSQVDTQSADSGMIPFEMSFTPQPDATGYEIYVDGQAVGASTVCVSSLVDSLITASELCPLDGSRISMPFEVAQFPTSIELRPWNMLGSSSTDVPSSLWHTSPEATPTRPSVSQTGPTTAVVNFEAPLPSDALGRHVYVSGGNFQVPTLAGVVVGSGVSLSLSSLEANAVYTFQVATYNKLGESPLSEAVTLRMLAPPTTPALTVRQPSEGTFTLGVTQQVANTQYQWRVDGAVPGDAWFATTNSSSVSFSGFVPGRSYDVEVRAHNLAGTSQWSPVVVVYALHAPTLTSVKQFNGDTLVLDLELPSEYRPAPFTVLLDGTEQTLVGDYISGTHWSLSISPVSKSGIHTVRVAAGAGDTTGPLSQGSSVVMIGAPSSPTLTGAELRMMDNVLHVDLAVSDPDVEDVTVFTYNDYGSTEILGSSLPVTNHAGTATGYNITVSDAQMSRLGGRAVFAAVSSRGGMSPHSANVVVATNQEQQHAFMLRADPDLDNRIVAYVYWISVLDSFTDNSETAVMARCTADAMRSLGAMYPWGNRAYLDALVENMKLVNLGASTSRQLLNYMVEAAVVVASGGGSDPAAWTAFLPDEYGYAVDTAQFVVDHAAVEFAKSSALSVVQNRVTQWLLGSDSGVPVPNAPDLPARLTSMAGASADESLLGCL